MLQQSLDSHTGTATRVTGQSVRDISLLPMGDEPNNEYQLHSLQSSPEVACHSHAHDVLDTWYLNRGRAVGLNADVQPSCEFQTALFECVLTVLTVSEYSDG